jgi:putative transposase
VIFREALQKDQGIQISMDGLGCWRDTIFVERLWRSSKYEKVHLPVYATVSAAPLRAGVLSDVFPPDSAASST